MCIWSLYKKCSELAHSIIFRLIVTPDIEYELFLFIFLEEQFNLSKCHTLIENLTGLKDL